MNYENAKIIIDKNRHLIGKYRNESRMDDIIAVPSDNNLFDIFIKQYIQGNNAEKAIEYYCKSDLKVIIIFDKNLLFNNNMLIYEDIHELKNEFDIYL